MKINISAAISLACLIALDVRACYTMQSFNCHNGTPGTLEQCPVDTTRNDHYVGATTTATLMTAVPTASGDYNETKTDETCTFYTQNQSCDDGYYYTSQTNSFSMPVYVASGSGCNLLAENGVKGTHLDHTITRTNTGRLAKLYADVVTCANNMVRSTKSIIAVLISWC